ncbi:MAG: ATP-binding cassette domain-containing protein, partial [Cyclobacteriaceae bacterium]
MSNQMPDSKFKFLIQTSNGGELNIPLAEGKALFVLGANGVGKSTLMHKLLEQNFNHSKRILAHRQTWFTTNTKSITAAQKKNSEKSIKNFDRSTKSRWQDGFSADRSNISIFDLINSENVRARAIAEAVDRKDIELAQLMSEKQAPLHAVNELLSISN